MEEKILNDEEAELFGLKRKINPDDQPDDQPNDQPKAEEGVADTDDEAEDVSLSAVSDGGDAEKDSETAEEKVFDFGEAQEDDESLVMLSAEEAQAELRRREEEARKKQERFEKLLTDGNAALENADFETARQCFTEANELNSDDLELNVGYMRAYSEDFASMDDLESLQEAYGQCYESAGEAFATRIKQELGDKLQNHLCALEAEEKEKTAAFAAAQAERRQNYAARAKKVNVWLLAVGVPWLLCAVAAALCLYFINAVKGSIMIILSAVFGGVAVLLLVPTVLLAKKAMTVLHLRRENEKIYSTAEGRDLETLRQRIRFIENCLQ